MGINQKAFQEKKVKGATDIVFCFDCTGSMQPYIDNVKANVKTFVENLNTNENIVEWRVRVMGYRDFWVPGEEHLINNKPFVSTVQEFENQLGELDATLLTGGDAPESTLDAIWYAIKETEWGVNRHKVIVLFTDDTPQPIHPETISKLNITDDIELLLQEIKVRGVKLFMFCKKHPDYDLIGAAERTEVMQFSDPANELLNADFKKILETIGKTVSQLVTYNRVL